MQASSMWFHDVDDTEFRNETALPCLPIYAGFNVEIPETVVTVVAVRMYPTAKKKHRLR